MATKAIAKRKARTVYVRRVGRKAKSMTLPLAVIAGFVPMGMNVWNSYKEGGLDKASQSLVAQTTGFSRYDGKWHFDYLMAGMGPVLSGILVHKLANKLGINRAIARAGVPILRL